MDCRHHEYNYIFVHIVGIHIVGTVCIPADWLYTYSRWCLLVCSVVQALKLIYSLRIVASFTLEVYDIRWYSGPTTLQNACEFHIYQSRMTCKKQMTARRSVLDILLAVIEWSLTVISWMYVHTYTWLRKIQATIVSPWHCILWFRITAIVGMDALDWKPCIGGFTIFKWFGKAGKVLTYCDSNCDLYLR